MAFGWKKIWGLRTIIASPDRARVTISNSVTAGYSNDAINASGGGFIRMNIDHTEIAHNGRGLIANGDQTTMVIGNSTITQTGAGFVFANGGAILSYGTNKVNGNDPDGNPSGLVSYK